MLSDTGKDAQSCQRSLRTHPLPQCGTDFMPLPCAMLDFAPTRYRAVVLTS
jgi:hypothetical protein